MEYYVTSAKSKGGAKTSHDSHATMRTNIMGRYILVDQTGYVHYYQLPDNTIVWCYDCEVKGSTCHGRADQMTELRIDELLHY